MGTYTEPDPHFTGPDISSQSTVWAENSSERYKLDRGSV